MAPANLGGRMIGREGSVSRAALIILLLAVLAGVCVMNWQEVVALFGWGANNPALNIPQQAANAAGQDSGIPLLLGAAAKVHGEYNIPLNPMGELDFRTKKEVYDLRKSSILQHAGLIKQGYEPSEAVFGAIEDKKPWWGIHGIYGLGPGEKSIEGPSEESRFLLNPYLLVGLCETSAYKTGVTPHDYPPVYPNPVSIEWNAERSLEIINYDVHNHFTFLNSIRAHDPPQYKLDLIAYNARDLRFNYLYVDAGKSDGVVWANKEQQAVAIRQYIHCGASCGYAGGCNNMSPFQSELVIELKTMPAKAYIRLWRDTPRNVDGPSDMDVIINML